MKNLFYKALIRFTLLLALFISLACSAASPDKDYFSIVAGGALAPPIEIKDPATGQEIEGSFYDTFLNAGIQYYFNRYFGIRADVLMQTGSTGTYDTDSVTGDIDAHYIGLMLLGRYPVASWFDVYVGLGGQEGGANIHVRSNSSVYEKNPMSTEVTAQAGFTFHITEWLGVEIFARYLTGREDSGDGGVAYINRPAVGLNTIFSFVSGKVSDTPKEAPVSRTAVRSYRIPDEERGIIRPEHRNMEQNSPEAQYRIGYIYFYGREGAPQDYVVALEWFTKAARQNHIAAQNKLGVMYYYGYGTAQDFTAAAQWFQRASVSDNDAAYNLAYMLQHGQGVKQDYAWALQLYTKLVQSGYTDAVYGLGNMYYYGEGVAQDYAAAYDLFRQAAEDDHPDAQFSLAYMLLNAQGTARNNAQGVRWLEKAASGGSLEALNLLGVISLEGKAVKQNYRNAQRYFRAAADKNHPEALYYMGVINEEGYGVSQNYPEAVKYYQKAAQLNHVEAKYRLGVMYEEGKGVKQDYTLAVQWYQQAATSFADAKYQLGALYERGDGVDPNYDQAMYWYQLAAEEVPQARAARNNLQNRGGAIQREFSRAVEVLLAGLNFPPQTTVAVLPLTLEGDDRNAGYFTDMFDISVSARKTFKMVERRMINSVLNEMSFNMTIGDSSAVYEFLKADILFTGTIYKRADAYEFFIRLIRAENAEVVAQATVSVNRSLGLE
jgi:TPR repeat protein